jgi:crossover junction endodeoxyribonuclease RuvC
MLFAGTNIILFLELSLLLSAQNVYDPHLMNQPVKEKIILGIDPGTTIMGYGVLKVTGATPTMIAMGVIDLRKLSNHYLKLRHIYEKVLNVIESFLPDEVAIEAPFYGKNVQSMLKLGRAQGVAMAAALSRDIPIVEYAPLKIKMAITGKGQASKAQVAGMLQRMLRIPNSDMPVFMDATDGLAAAYCHFLQMNRPQIEKEYKGWKDFIAKNPKRIG